MKKFFIILTSVAVIFTAALIFAACAPTDGGGKPQEKDAVYTVTYADGGKILTELEVAYGGKAEEYIPEKQYYSFTGWALDGLPYDYAPVTGNIVLTATWEAKHYTVKFVCGPSAVATYDYTVESKDVTPPSVPEKEFYTGKWEDFALTGGNITVKAVYEPINYKILFYGFGGLCETVYYNVENYDITEPEVPQKLHYDGKWEEYELTSGDIKVYAMYRPTVYKVTFCAEGQTVRESEYNCVSLSVTPPAVPEKQYYTGEWEAYTLNYENITVNAVYTPIEYTLNFYADGTLCGTQTYTVEDKSIAEPEVPAKTHYTGVWESYGLDFKDTDVRAVYTPVEYGVEFFVDGELYATRTYTVENKNISEPVLPARLGYAGNWSPYTLDGGNVKINAVYTPLPATEGLIFTPNADGYAVTGLEEGFAPEEILIPSNYDGVPVTEIADNAFTGQSVTSVIVCGGVKRIGQYAFQSCTNLVKVALPDSLSELGNGVFYDCGFTEFKIPHGLTVIPTRCFQQCKNLKSITVPDTVTEIGDYAFCYCTALQSAVLGTGLTQIGKNAFGGTALTSAVFRDPVGWQRFDSAEAPAEKDMDFSSPEYSADALNLGPVGIYKKSKEN